MRNCYCKAGTRSYTQVVEVHAYRSCCTIACACAASPPHQPLNRLESLQRAFCIAHPVTGPAASSICPQHVSYSVVSNTLQLHGLQPTRLLCPWDSPGKDTGVGCHFLLHDSEHSSLCHTAGPCSLSTLYLIVCVNFYQRISELSNAC